MSSVIIKKCQLSITNNRSAVFLHKFNAITNTCRNMSKKYSIYYTDVVMKLCVIYLCLTHIVQLQLNRELIRVYF
jgi:hypothetical protein